MNSLYFSSTSQNKQIFKLPRKVCFYWKCVYSRKMCLFWEKVDFGKINNLYFSSTSQNKQIFPNKHISQKKHTFLGLTKMCLFWEKEDFGKIDSLYFSSSSQISTFFPNKYISQKKAHLSWPHENVLIMSGQSVQFCKRGRISSIQNHIYWRLGVNLQIIANNYQKKKFFYF